MRYPYFVSSLPSLAPGIDPPLTEEAFLEDAGRLLRPEDFRELERVLAGRAAEGGSAFAWAWSQGEIQLRNAVARERAKRRERDPDPGARPHEGYAVWLEKAVVDAYARPNPLERERTLDRTRWLLAEELEREDVFGLGAVLGYALRLKIVLRWAVWDAEAGGKRVEDFVAAAAESAAEPARTELN